MSKNSTLISWENCRFLGVKNSWKWYGLGLFSCWQLWFHEKSCHKKFGVETSWKCWGFVKIEFLDKNLTFRIVWFGLVCIDVSWKILKYGNALSIQQLLPPFFGVGDQILHEHAFTGENSWLLVVSSLLLLAPYSSYSSDAGVAMVVQAKHKKHLRCYLASSFEAKKW